MEDALKGTWLLNDTVPSANSALYWALEATMQADGYSVTIPYSAGKYTYNQMSITDRAFKHIPRFNFAVYGGGSYVNGQRFVYFGDDYTGTAVSVAGWYYEDNGKYTPCSAPIIKITSTLAEVENGDTLLAYLQANATKQGEEPATPGATVTYDGGIIASVVSGGTATLRCAGKKMKTDITIKAAEGGANLPNYDGGVDVEGEEIPVVFKLQEKTADKNGDVIPDEGYDGLSKVTVNVPIPYGYIKPSGGIEVNSNGTYNVSDKATVTVNVDIPEPPASYDGKVTITKKVTLDPEFNHYGVIPEGCMLDVCDADGEMHNYIAGDPFPAPEVIYDAQWCTYIDGNGCTYLNDDANGVVEKTVWYYGYSEMGRETSETRILESIGGVPVVAILGLGDSLFAGEKFYSLTIPKSITYIVLVSTDGFSAIEYPNLTAITYLGTTAEWNNITFGEDWNNGCPEITVTCTDGTITIPAYGS